MIDVRHGDACAELRQIDTGTIDAAVTDPPYGLGFMAAQGCHWDSSTPDQDVWRECLRVLKPGGHLLAFGSPRTYHRVATSIEGAGFEIRDQLMWLRGDNFPKARTQLKTAHEPIVLARKPFSGSEAANTLQHGTGGLNVEPCRVGSRADKPQKMGKKASSRCYGSIEVEGGKLYKQGRWPANVIHDGCLNGKPYEPYFYAAKASAAERGEYNSHTTVKPLALMRYLVRLVTPEGGLVIDPFLGSGTTAVACVHEGRSCIGIDREAEYIEIARRRLSEAA